MDWKDWYKHYDELPSLQTRLRLAQEQIAATLDQCPPGPIRIVSVCAGDGRDVIGTLIKHPRRRDVNAALLENHLESVERGREAAKHAELTKEVCFVHADATLAGNYQGHVPADLVLLSGFLGHLRHEDVPRLITSLPMLCKTGGWIIWNRHLILNKGREQVSAIRMLFRGQRFEEVYYDAPEADGFAVGRVRFSGKVLPLDPSRVMFKFVGLDRLLSAPLPGPSVATETPTTATKTTSQIAADEALFDVEQSIPARYAQVAALNPSRIALGSGEWQPTYAELNAAANRFAHLLLNRDGAKGDRVALLMNHDTPLIAAVLAILKAGMVIVVLNTSDPPTRLKEIVEDADATFIVTDELNGALAKQVAGPVGVLSFNRHSEGPNHNPEVSIAPDALAFLVYTSGSTGRPKGVMQTHRNILHNVCRHTQGMGLQADDRIILMASLSGGQGLGTTWCALLNGAALCPFATMERGVVSLADWLVTHHITVYVSSASVYRRFVTTLTGNERFPNIRLVRLASEAATAKDFAAYQRHFRDDCILLSTYSSSETGSIAQQRFIKSDSVAAGRLPVGWPKLGMEVRLWDEHGQEVREGETGEIVARSRYISPGYWRQQSLTKERFSPDPDRESFRLYRSGDLGRLLPDSSLMFMGRRDHQVKVHGYRVETSEIEDALSGQPEVQAAVVVPRTLASGDTQLDAYVVLQAKQRCDTEELRRRLRKALPGYMVPVGFVFLDKFPLTPHGKVDRAALPPPPETSHRTQRTLKPRDVVERNLAKIFESVLGVSPVGRRDDFFDLGGTSLQSVEVLTAIEEVFDVALPPSALIEHSTVERLAPLLSNHAVIPSSRPLVELRKGDGQRPLFLIHSGQGDVVTYGLLIRKLRDRPVFGLQAVGVQGESWPLMSIPAMADRYLPEILAKDPTGPYLLAGTCMGGIVAFELAQRLVKMGRKVNLLALMDSPAPPYSGRRALWHEVVIDPFRDAVRVCRWGIGHALGQKIPVRKLPSYRRFVAGMTGLANRRYRLEPYPGTLTLFLTADTEFSAGDRRRVMAGYARETRTLIIPGSRPGLFVRPAVDELARQLQSCLEMAEVDTGN